MKQRKPAPAGPIVAAIGLGWMGMSDSYDDRDHRESIATSRAGWSNSKNSKNDASTHAHSESLAAARQNIMAFSVAFRTPCFARAMRPSHRFHLSTPRGYGRTVFLISVPSVNRADGISEIEGKAAMDSGERVGKGASFKSVVTLLWDLPPRQRPWPKIIQ